MTMTAAPSTTGIRYDRDDDFGWSRILQQVADESRRRPIVEPPRPTVITPSDIPYSLSRIEGLPADSLDAARAVAHTVATPEARIRAHAIAIRWIAASHGRGDGTDCWRWEQDWHGLPVKFLRETFTFEEIMRLWHGSILMSETGRWIDEEHPFLRKIAFAHWHYGMGRDWNLLVDHLEAFKKLDAGLPDFEVRITHTRTINMAAWSAHVDGLYLDASFGLLLYYKGKHVLTLGFAPCEHGVLVAQAQLRNKKGNRFLYHLPDHYLDLGIDILRRAFGDCIWLVTGQSAVDATRSAYGSQPCSVTAEVEARMKSLYDRPLAAFVRGKATCKHEGRIYVRLHHKPSPKAA